MIQWIMLKLYSLDYFKINLHHHIHITAVHAIINQAPFSSSYPEPVCLLEWDAMWFGKYLPRLQRNCCLGHQDLPWQWRQHIPLQCQCILTWLQSSAPHNTLIFLNIIVKNLTSLIIWVEQSMNYGLTDIISPKGNINNSHDWASTRMLNICWINTVYFIDIFFYCV